jgi:GNAT superfamily N-acetyltransferase
MPNLRPPPRCPDFVAHQGRGHEYSRAKAILNIGKHPTFIGRDLYATSSRNGGAMFFTVDGRDAAVALINPRTNCLLVLCVAPAFRGRGLGQAIVAYLQVSFARVIESAVPFFERCGFVGLGEPKMGKRWKTQIMVLKRLRELAGRVSLILADR